MRDLDSFLEPAGADQPDGIQVSIAISLKRIADCLVILVKERSQSHGSTDRVGSAAGDRAEGA